MKTNTVGSYYWMRATNSQLKFQEKIKIIQKVKIPSAMNFIIKNYYIFQTIDIFDDVPCY